MNLFYFYARSIQRHIRQIKKNHDTDGNKIKVTGRSQTCQLYPIGNLKSIQQLRVSIIICIAHVTVQKICSSEEN